MGKIDKYKIYNVTFNNTWFYEYWFRLPDKKVIIDEYTNRFLIYRK